MPKTQQIRRLINGRRSLNMSVKPNWMRRKEFPVIKCFESYDEQDRIDCLCDEGFGEQIQFDGLISIWNGWLDSAWIK